MRGLAGCVAIVTGAGRERGIGRATALRLAAESAKVIVSARSLEGSGDWRGATQVAEEIGAAGGEAHAVACDVADAGQVRHLITETLRVFGHIDAVVNNGALAVDLNASPLLTLDDALWRRTLDVNVTGVYLVARAAAKVMIDCGRGGAIVNVASVGGRMGIANHGAYCASKFAVIGLTQQMALEWAAHKIRVNAVCPGVTNTDMLDNAVATIAAGGAVAPEAVRAGVCQSVPLGRFGDPSEQAATIAFLLSDESSYTTGQTLNVDGGFRMD